MMIQMDTENAKSMAAACRALAGELERLPAVLGPMEASSGKTPDLAPLLPLLTVSRCIERALLIAGAMRTMAQKLDTLPMTEHGLQACLRDDESYAKLMALFDPPR